MSHLQSSKGGENKYILVYFKNTLLDDSEFSTNIPLLGLYHFDYHYHFDKVEPGVSGQLYTLLGDREKIFAPMRFHRFNVQCNSIFLLLGFLASIFIFTTGGDRISIKPAWFSLLLCKTI